jgi:hypothetical protein
MLFFTPITNQEDKLRASLSADVRFVRASAEDAGKAATKINCNHALPGFTGDLDHFGVDLQGGR